MSMLPICPTTLGVRWQYVPLLLEYAGSMSIYFWSMLAVCYTSSGVCWQYLQLLLEYSGCMSYCTSSGVCWHNFSLLLKYASSMSHYLWNMPNHKSICEMCTFLPVSHLGVFRYLGNSRLCSVVWYYLPPPHTPGRGVVGKHKNTASKILGHSWAAIFLHFVWMDSVTRIVVNLTLSMGCK